MKKKAIFLGVLFSGSLLSFSLHADNSLYQNKKNSVKLTKADYSSRKKSKEDKPASDLDIKKDTSRLPIFAKSRKDKHYYEELCVKGSHHILINKKRARAYCKELHS